MFIVVADEYTRGWIRDLTNHQLSVSESVRRDLQVERSRALADAARNIVVGAVARAEPTVVLTGAGDGHATKMCANTEHNQPTQQRIVKKKERKEMQLKENPWSIR